MDRTETFKKVVQFIRQEFNTPDDFIPLHEPRFIGNERKYVLDAIDSTFVSSAGAYVDKFEAMIRKITGSGFAIATVNGTSALHVALVLAGVKPCDEVITQPLSFVATANAISYTGARPLFIDVDRESLGLSPEKLKKFLKENLKKKNGRWVNKNSESKIAACVPMHTFGLPARIDEITGVCDTYEIPVVEDSAESLGSTYKNRQTGTFGMLGIYSFNGNKTVTSGGGGAIVTDDRELAEKARHLTTTAKKNHKWEYVHDYIGFNYRMPNLNAALACAQLEMLDEYLSDKRNLANRYQVFFRDHNIKFISELNDSFSNYWLNAIRLNNRAERDDFLTFTNEHGVMTRPVWRLLNKLVMYKDCPTGNLENSEWLEGRIVNIPSSVRIKT